jgi:serine-type D-Ala-D-Ala carboxypeptidase/endopeptidase (penicillin-binding protein 4)
VISSRPLAVVCVLAAIASAQPAPGSGSETAPEHDEEDEGATTGSGAPVLVAPPDPAARVIWLRDRLAAAIAQQPALAKARITYAITDLATGKEVLAREPDKAMNLASNAKLLTSVAALRGIGGGFRWRTAVFAAVKPDDTGTVTGDLHLRGRGDPLLSQADLKALAADVAAAGVRNVEGRLVLDTAYFDGVTEPPHFGEQPKEQAAFRAPIASLLVDHGGITVTIMADPGGKARVTVDPALPGYIKLTKDEVTSVTTGRTRLKVDIKPKRDHIEIEASGQIRAGEGSWDVRKRVDDPARLAAEVFKKELADQGVRVRQSAIALGPVPPTAVMVAAHNSPTLADVLRAMNKHSDNNVAECVLKTLGAETKGTPAPATWADGTVALHAQLAKLGIAPNSFRADNGSGLYAATEVSAHQLVRLLVAAHQDYRIGPDLVASLPVGGADGTLARRWKGKPAQGRVRAKTGTLDRVSTLAGYVGVETGHLLAFAILVNDIPPGQRPHARAMVDDMIDSLAAYLGAR